jgi:hypothetical protein
MNASMVRFAEVMPAFIVRLVRSGLALFIPGLDPPLLSASHARTLASRLTGVGRLLQLVCRRPVQGPRHFEPATGGGAMQPTQSVTVVNVTRVLVILSNGPGETFRRMFFFSFKLGCTGPGELSGECCRLQFGNSRAT